VQTEVTKLGRAKEELVQRFLELLLEEVVKVIEEVAG
jgi:hypothetical protein